MTESLRERCIEAIDGRPLMTAEERLDAVLDVLEESAEEWASVRPELWGDADNLLVVLRGNGG